MKAATCQAPGNTRDSNESESVRPRGRSQAGKETQLPNMGDKQ